MAIMNCFIHLLLLPNQELVACAFVAARMLSDKNLAVSEPRPARRKLVLERDKSHPKGYMYKSPSAFHYTSVHS